MTHVFKPFNKIVPSLGTQIACLAIKSGSRLFKTIANNILQDYNNQRKLIKKGTVINITPLHSATIEKAPKISLNDIYTCLNDYFSKYAKYKTTLKISAEKLKEYRKEFKEWFIPNTLISTGTGYNIIPVLNNTVKNYLTDKLKEPILWDAKRKYTMNIAVGKQLKRKTTKRFNHMLNQSTMKIQIDKENIVTAMCFCNLSITLTGCKKTKFGIKAINALLTVYKSLKLLQPPRVVMTTCHCKLNSPLDLASLGTWIKEKVNNANSFYSPDTTAYLTIIYATGIDQECKFVIRETGKCMISSKHELDNMRAGYNAVMSAVADFLKE